MTYDWRRRGSRLPAPKQPTQPAIGSVPESPWSNAPQETTPQVSPVEPRPESPISRPKAVSDLTPEEKQAYDAVVAEENKVLPQLQAQIETTKAKLSDLQKTMDANQQSGPEFNDPNYHGDQTKYDAYKAAYNEFAPLQNALSSYQNQYDAAVGLYHAKRLDAAGVTTSYTGPTSAEISKANEQTITVLANGGYTKEGLQSAINDLVTAGVLDTAGVKAVENDPTKIQGYIDKYNTNVASRNAILARLDAIPGAKVDGGYNLRAARDAGFSTKDMITLGFPTKSIIDSGMKPVEIPGAVVSVTSTDVSMANPSDIATTLTNLSNIEDKQAGEYLTNLFQTGIRNNDYTAFNNAVDNFNQASTIKQSQFEAQQREFMLNNVLLPDHNWIAAEDLSKTKIESPEVFKLLTTKGIDAANAYITNFNAKQASQAVATANTIAKATTARDVYQALTPWDESKGQTVVDYAEAWPKRVVDSYKSLVTPPKKESQADLKIIYDVQQKARTALTAKQTPIWAKAIILATSTTAVVYNKGNDTYKRIITTEAPPLVGESKIKPTINVQASRTLAAIIKDALNRLPMPTTAADSDVIHGFGPAENGIPFSALGYSNSISKLKDLGILDVRGNLKDFAILNVLGNIKPIVPSYIQTPVVQTARLSTISDIKSASGVRTIVLPGISTVTKIAKTTSGKYESTITTPSTTTKLTVTASPSISKSVQSTPTITTRITDIPLKQTIQQATDILERIKVESTDTKTKQDLVDIANKLSTGINTVGTTKLTQTNTQLQTVKQAQKTLTKVQTEIDKITPSLNIKKPSKPKIPILPQFKPNQTDSEKRAIIRDSGGAFTWQQGKLHNKPVRHVVIAPFRQQDVTVVLGKPVAGALDVGKGQSKRTLRITKGNAPTKAVTLEGGAIDPTITPLSRKKIRIDFHVDKTNRLHSKRIGRVFRTRIGSGTVLSRKPLGKRSR